MRNSLRTIALTFPLLLVACGRPPSEGPGNSDPGLIPEAVQESIEERVRVGRNVGLVVGVVTEDGRSISSAGMRALGGSGAVGPETEFEIGSVSKVFAGTLLAVDVISGRVSLGDPLSTVLPEGAGSPDFEGHEIELVHLATHSAGFPRAPSNLNPKNPEDPFANYTLQDALQFLGTFELQRLPGSGYAYSNYGMGLLGDLLGILSGGDFESALAEEVTGPLGMEHTFITWEGFEGDRARGHRLGEEVSDWGFSSLAGAGGVRSDVNDLLTFLEANLGLRKTTLTPALELAQQAHGATDDPQMRIGLGWHIFNQNDEPIIWHNGTTGGFSAFLGFLPRQRRGVVILTNSATGADDLGWHLLDPSLPLSEVKRPIAVELRRALDSGGEVGMVKRLGEILDTERDAFDVSYPELKRLAYSFLPDRCGIAIALFHRIASSHPEEVDALLSLAEALYTCEQPDSAIAKVKEAQLLDPDNPVAAQFMTILQGEGGNP